MIIDKDVLLKDLSIFFKIKENNLKKNDVTLRTIMEESEVAVNSIDIMEGFAEVLQKNDIDDKVDIPVFTLEDKLSSVLEEIINQSIKII